MSRLPVCSGADAVKVFHQLGYEVAHQWQPHHSSSFIAAPSNRSQPSGACQRNFAGAHPRGRSDERAIHGFVALNFRSSGWTWAELVFPFRLIT
jgi:hypothetical protein